MLEGTTLELDWRWNNTTSIWLWPVTETAATTRPLRLFKNHGCPQLNATFQAGNTLELAISVLTAEIRGLSHCMSANANRQYFDICKWCYFCVLISSSVMSCVVPVSLSCCRRGFILSSLLHCHLYTRFRGSRQRLKYVRLT
jgi:hypothetical protein